MSKLEDLADMFEAAKDEIAIASAARAVLTRLVVAKRHDRVDPDAWQGALDLVELWESEQRTVGAGPDTVRCLECKAIIPNAGKAESATIPVVVCGGLEHVLDFGNFQLRIDGGVVVQRIACEEVEIPVQAGVFGGGGDADVQG